MKKLIAFVLTLVCLLSLVGCAKEINTITDFSKFADMTKDGTDKIEVTFDNNTGTPFYFTIEEKEDIDEIMDIIFSACCDHKDGLFYLEPLMNTNAH